MENSDLSDYSDYSVSGASSHTRKTYKSFKKLPQENKIILEDKENPIKLFTLNEILDSIQFFDSTV